MPKKPVLIIVHRAESETGRVGQWLRAHGYAEDIRRLALGHELPDTLEHHSGAIIFGGPMGVSDTAEFPFLQDELDWLPRAAEQGVPLLGVCLGAQLIAKALGGDSVRHPHGAVEIGYYPLFATEQGLEHFPAEMHAFQWHGDAIIAPPGAELLASGDSFAVQAYRVDRHITGIQFHPEVTRAMWQRWVVRAAHRLAEPGAQPRSQQLAARALHDPQNILWLDRFMSHWLGED